MTKFKLLACAAMGVGLAAVAAPKADAALVVSYQVGAGAATQVTDNGAGDLNPVLGAVLTTAAGTGYSFIIETAQGFPAVGSPASPVLRLAVDGNTSGSTGNAPTLTLMATQTDFITSGATLFDLASGVNFPAGGDGSAPLATAEYTYYLDNSNTAFGQGTTLGGATFTFTSPTESAQATNQLVSGTPDGSFSLTTMLVLSGLDAGRGFAANAAISAQQAAVPEPASLALLGAGLLGLGMVRRRRKTAA